MTKTLVLKSVARTLAIGLALVLGAIASIAARPASAADLEEAWSLYERGRYPEAEVKLVAAAEGGDARAQELLGFMYAFGPHVYPGIRRDLVAADQWFDRAARSGSPTARYLHCALTRRSVELRRRELCFDRILHTGEPVAVRRNVR